MPTILWLAFVDEVRAGRFDALTAADGDAGWTAWGAGAGQVAREPTDEVIVRYHADAEHRENRLPSSIWEQILVAVRAHAVDDLDAAAPARPGEVRPSGFLLLHGNSLRPARPRPDDPDRRPSG
ncbi:hypothetical protein [Frankia sp. AiPa1]|uniref:hypothetical protein n=1 Tax=Frankia sp. AiPa1 TaxID=573492 RepID=UPI00202B8075|nr:hypothetical protein [Frankia sp. AiPa1]MCL9759178.1 hypothetical protein [Frankia sp. AiPa1]